MGYEQFLAQRERLRAAMVATADVAAALGADTRARHLREAAENLLGDAFRLMVAGEFKRGKSTLINALLGEAVLPARVAPCTALITEVKHGDPRAVLWPIDGGPPRDVPVARLRDYLVIADEDDPRPPEWAKMEVFHPRPLLANNVLIIDSPGLNEHHVRNEIALDYLPKADAMILVLSCEQALSASEIAFLEENVRGTGLRHVFFVWNRYLSLIHI